MSESEQAPRPWLFLTAHMHVLLYVAANADATGREIAGAVGITERHALRVLGDLFEGGYLEKQRRGARNVYRVRRDAPFKHPLLASVEIGRLLDALQSALRADA
jgi:hypothetical protein